LLEALQSLELAFGGAIGVARLYQLRFEAQNFLLCAAALERMHVGIGGADPCQGLRLLAASVSSIEFDEQLPFPDAVSFFHQHSLYGGADRRVGFKIVDRLNFSIRRDDALYGAARHGSSKDRHRIVARSKRGEQNDGRRRAAAPKYPPPSREKTGFSAVVSHLLATTNFTSRPVSRQEPGLNF
jgi:hypothetical protein